MSNLVTVKVSTNPSDLYIAQSLLESENIPCIISGEIASRIYPVTSNVFGGAQLQVNEEDYGRAVYLLIEGGFAQPEDFQPSKGEVRLTNAIEKISSFFKSKK